MKSEQFAARARFPSFLGTEFEKACSVGKRANVKNVDFDVSAVLLLRKIGMEFTLVQRQYWHLEMPEPTTREEKNLGSLPPSGVFMDA